MKTKASPNKIVLERIDALFSKAEESAEASPENSRRYIDLAIKNAMRYNVPVPAKYRMSYCSKCHSYLKAGVSSTHRTSRKQESLIITCKECGNIMRFPYRKERAVEKKAKN